MCGLSYLSRLDKVQHQLTLVGYKIIMESPHCPADRQWLVFQLQAAQGSMSAIIATFITSTCSSRQPSTGKTPAKNISGSSIANFCTTCHTDRTTVFSDPFCIHLSLEPPSPSLLQTLPHLCHLQHSKWQHTSSCVRTGYGLPKCRL